VVQHGCSSRCRIPLAETCQQSTTVHPFVQSSVSMGDWCLGVAAASISQESGCD
jgi:hypothetical protein